MAAAQAEKEKAEAAEKAIAAKPDMPDVPPELARCVVKDPKPGKDANQWVANMALTLEERKVCAKRLLEWYRTVQKANAKTATVQKKAKL